MSQSKDNVKYAYRLPPCPAYDVAGTERWLAEMARRGLHLAPDGFAFGIVSFERGEPAEVIYRLEAVPKVGFFDDGDTPDEEAVELAAEYGWEYVCKRGEFYIYRTEETNARELNTDPRVQALAMKALRARQRWALLDILFWVLIYPLARNGALLYRTPLLSSLTFGSWLTLFCIVMITWYCARAIVRAVALERRYRRLARGEDPDDGRSGGERRAHRHRAVSVVRVVLTVLWIVLVAVRTLNLMVETDEVTLGEYLASGGEIPFATVTELAETQGEVSDFRHIMNDFGNTVRVWSDPIASVNIDYCEITEVVLSDGLVIEGGLYVEYHEAANEQLAAALAREHYRFDRAKKNHDSLTLASSVPADLVYAYRDNLHMPTVIIQKGNRVIRASFHRYSESTEIPIEIWAQAVAESIS